MYVDTRVLNTIAWIKAIANSSITKKTKINIGTYCIKNNIPVQPANDQQIPAIIFNNACPAIILAKSRNDKLIGLKKYEINSIGIKIKAKAPSLPAGKNRVKNDIPWVRAQIILIPKKTTKAIVKVTINCAVKVEA